MKEKYPVEIYNLFSKIEYFFSMWFSTSSLLIVGSYSTASALYQLDQYGILYISDIDLLLVTADEIDQVLAFRNHVSIQLANIEKSVRSCDNGFHIGMRYRKVDELDLFSQKVESLGYKFWEDAVWLSRNCKLQKNRSIDFTIGHFTENICSKLWVVILHMSLKKKISSIPELHRSASRALQCMEASVAYLYAKKKERVNLPNLSPDSCYNDPFLWKLTRYGRLAIQLAKKYPMSCAMSSFDEEYDFFKVAKKNCFLLPELLVNLLEVGWTLKVYGKSNSDCLNSLQSIAKRLRLWSEEDSFRDDSSMYETIRLRVATKRMEMSELFRRDRGENFLSSL